VEGFATLVRLLTGMAAAALPTIVTLKIAAAAKVDFASDIIVAPDS
jgi:hypothetical protein